LRGRLGEERKKKGERTGVIENFVSLVDGGHLGFAPAFVRVCSFGRPAADERECFSYMGAKQEKGRTMLS